MDIEELLRSMPAGFDPVAECDRMFGSLDVIDGALDEIRATATSPDGLVEVTVGAGGELRELALDPRVYHRPDSQALAAMIVATAATAAADAAQQVAAATRRVVPGAFGTAP